MRAHNAVGSGPWGNPCTASTAPAAPSEPLALRLAAAGEASLALSWQPPSSDHGAPVGCYQVELAPLQKGAAGGGGGGGSAGAGWQRVWQGPDLACTLPGLKPGRSYQARVRAQNARGWGPWGEAAAGGTAAGPPGAPRGPLQFSGRAATSIKVRWQAPADDRGAAVICYILQAACPARGQGWGEVYRGPEHSARVSGLEPATDYEFRLAACNVVGQGPWGSAERAATGLRPPGPPAGVEVGVASPAELQQQAAAEHAAGGGGGGGGGSGRGAAVVVTWQPPEPAGDCAEAIGYEVEATCSISAGAGAGAGAGASKLPGQARGTRHVVTGLVPGSTVSVRVRSVGAGGAGHSDWSSSSQCELPAGVAPAVPGDGGAAAGGGGAGAGEGATSPNGGGVGAGGGKGSAGKRQARKAAQAQAAGVRGGAEAAFDARRRRGRAAPPAAAAAAAQDPAALVFKKRAWRKFWKVMKLARYWGAWVLVALGVIIFVWGCIDQVLSAQAGRKQLQQQLLQQQQHIPVSMPGYNQPNPAEQMAREERLAQRQVLGPGGQGLAPGHERRYHHPAEQVGLQQQQIPSQRADPSVLQGVPLPQQPQLPRP